MGAGDAVCLGGLVVLLLVMSYVQSRGRPFWSDEILGWVVLRQSTVGGMLRLWRAGLDGSGIWFFLFGRVWAGVFGASEVSLRMYSAVGVAAGAALVWAAARRFYALLPVAVSVTFVCAAARVMRWQLANARSYGWLLFGCGLVIFMIARGEEEQHWKPGKRFLVATFLAYSALAGGHLLAAIYVGALLGAQVGIDLLQRRWRPWMYTSAACSLGVVWFARANIVASAAVGKPYFWTVKPGMRDLVESTSALGRPIAASIGLAAAGGDLSAAIAAAADGGVWADGDVCAAGCAAVAVFAGEDVVVCGPVPAAVHAGGNAGDVRAIYADRGGGRGVRAAAAGAAVGVGGGGGGVLLRAAGAEAAAAVS